MAHEGIQGHDLLPELREEVRGDSCRRAVSRTHPHTASFRRPLPSESASNPPPTTHNDSVRPLVGLSRAKGGLGNPEPGGAGGKEYLPPCRGGLTFGLPGITAAIGNADRLNFSRRARGELSESSSRAYHKKSDQGGSRRSCPYPSDRGRNDMWASRAGTFGSRLASAALLLSVLLISLAHSGRASAPQVRGCPRSGPRPRSPPRPGGAFPSAGN